MKYEFITYINGKQTDCYIDTLIKTVSDHEGIILGYLEEGIGTLPIIETYQYIGKKDSNGNKIYAGSLIFIDDQDDTLYEVAWNEELAGFGLKFHDPRLNEVWAPVVFKWEQAQVFAHIGGVEQ